MALVYFTGFESGAAVANNEMRDYDGTTSVTNTQAHSGTYSIRCNPSGTAVGWQEFRKLDATGAFGAGDNITTSYLSFYIRIATRPKATTSEEIARIVTGGPALKSAIRMNSDGTLRLYDSANAAVDVATSALSTDTWYRLDWTVGTGATAPAWLSVYNDDGSQLGATVGSATAANTAAAMNTLNIGKRVDTAGDGAQTYDVYFDDLWYDDATLRGAHEVVCAQPDGNATSPWVWTGGTGGSDYTQVSEIPASDAEYVAITGSGAGLFNVESSATIGASGTINAVGVYARIAEQSDPTSFVIRIAANGNLDTSATTTLTPSAYNRRFLQSAVDGASAAWTTGSVDAAQAGVVSGDTGEHRCSSLLVMVDYTPAAATSIPVFAHHYRQQGIQ